MSVPTRDKAGNIIEEAGDMENATTLFGISCNRQINSVDLKERPADVTRSTVHKSVVVIARKPIFGPIREKLAVITRAFFQQGDFTDLSLIDNLYDNLNQLFSSKLDESVMYVGMSIRELIFRLGNNVLILLKALLLEKKIIFYSRSTEVLCASQFSLVSLVPALMEHLEDCCSPLLHKFEHQIKKPLSLKSSDRNSLLAYMGLPLQPFAEGGLFNPYVPLQQIDELKAPESKYFLVGSTNSLLLETSLADVIAHMDNDTVDICTSGLKNVLALSPSDKKWIDYVVKSVVDTWDPEDPWRPKGMGFYGSEDFVRQQFEDYIMGLMSSVKYDSFLSKFGSSPPKAMTLREVDGNPVKLFNQSWVKEWRTTNNFRIFSGITDNEIFDIVEPRHMASSILANDKHHRHTSVLSQASHQGSLEDKTKSKPVRPRSRVAKAWGSFWWGSQEQSQIQAHLPAKETTQSNASPKSGTSGTSDEFHDEDLGPDNSSSPESRTRTNTISTTHSVSVLVPVRSIGSTTSSSQKSEESKKSQQSQVSNQSQPSASASANAGIFTGWSLWGNRGRAKSQSVVGNTLSLHAAGTRGSASISGPHSLMSATGSPMNSPITANSLHSGPFSPISTAAVVDGGLGSPSSFMSARRFGGPANVNGNGNANMNANTHPLPSR